MSTCVNVGMCKIMHTPIQVGIYAHIQCMPLAESCFRKVVILYSNDCVEIGLEGLRIGHHR